ncbi:AraC family transcriptional regulator [Aquimarina sp. 2201CG5-10]|uniref:helix-turn-helix transcriptional regulator n=1 Tax=Aquimarina callyspongiae TaxID=3098150 RepID=UPI002AB590DB|nr:AraC family transcriptional regulator [Aquimarina sp. 2201CG5-10]MDY8137688.1 AraC family transcriptional regulator [Aquimarina sp. 2201CG5-10]
MEIVTLPKDLQLEDVPLIQMFDYETSDECSKQRINLTQNTISFLREGFKEVITDNSSISIHNSDFLLMKSGHCLMTEKLSIAKNHYRSILLFFSDQTIFEFIRKYNITHKKNVEGASVMAFQYDHFIHTFVSSLIDINKLDSNVRNKILQVKFEELMLYLIEKQGVIFLYSLIENINDQSRNLIKIVENNKLNKLTLKELAFLSNMSVSTFKREFEKHFQESPIKWFQDKRLEYSAFLLKSESKRPSDIFEEIGYENLSNFIHAFKTKFGVTPKQYQIN